MTDRDGETDETVSDLSLADVLSAAAEGLSGLTSGEEEGATTWTAAGRVFATLLVDRAEFRLDPLVARAALRTPDTTASPRGAGWVAFAPSLLDDAAIDRAEAWFLSAHRMASAIRH